MGAVLDLFKVLYEPGAVFTRVSEKPKFLMPFIGLCIIQVIVAAVNLPFLKAAMSAQFAAQAANAPAGAPDPSKFVALGLIAVPIVIAILLLISALVLWVLVSIVGGDGKFGTLLSVSTYACVPSVVLLAIVGAIVLQMKGPEGITSPSDLQPALGLDLLAPDTKGFVGAVLKGINPFTIWGLVLTAIGIQVTHKTSKGSAYAVAIGAMALTLIVAGAVAMLRKG
jgi:hypothetical protein